MSRHTHPRVLTAKAERDKDERITNIAMMTLLRCVHGRAPPTLTSPTAAPAGRARRNQL